MEINRRKKGTIRNKNRASVIGRDGNLAILHFDSSRCRKAMDGGSKAETFRVNRRKHK